MNTEDLISQVNRNTDDIKNVTDSLVSTKMRVWDSQEHIERLHKALESAFKKIDSRDGEVVNLRSDLQDVASVWEDVERLDKTVDALAQQDLDTMARFERLKEGLEASWVRIERAENFSAQLNLQSIDFGKKLNSIDALAVEHVEILAQMELLKKRISDLEEGPGLTDQWIVEHDRAIADATQLTVEDEPRPKSPVMDYGKGYSAAITDVLEKLENLYMHTTLLSDKTYNELFTIVDKLGKAQYHLPK